MPAGPSSDWDPLWNLYYENCMAVDILVQVIFMRQSSPGFFEMAKPPEHSCGALVLHLYGSWWSGFYCRNWQVVCCVCIVFGAGWWNKASWSSDRGKCGVLCLVLLPQYIILQLYCMLLYILGLLTFSLLRVINVKFLLQPHQKYYITE